jgi:hypothetical protein
MAQITSVARGSPATANDAFCRRERDDYWDPRCGERVGSGAGSGSLWLNLNR